VNCFCGGAGAWPATTPLINRLSAVETLGATVTCKEEAIPGAELEETAGLSSSEQKEKILNADACLLITAGSLIPFVDGQVVKLRTHWRH